MLSVFNRFGLNDWRQPVSHNPSLSFRKGEPKDLPQLLSMHDRADVTNMSERDRQNWGRELEGALRARYRRVIVAEEGEPGNKNPVGFAVAAPWDKNLRRPPSVMMLVVEPAAQGRGLGHALMNRAESYLSQFGRPQVQLQVNEHNERAIHLYQQRGYSVTKREAYAYGNEDAALTMSKDIATPYKAVTPVRRILSRLEL